MRLMTKFKSLELSKYLVETWLVDLEIHRFIESAIFIRISWWTEWWGNKESQLLPLMLKSSVMIGTLLIFASASLRYFKANWDESK